MRPWERRLKDLAQLLKNCESTYFDPNLFRMNTNQFLQTARTVTFIIQKNKASIPDYDNWYNNNVVYAWKNEELMQWAKDSRNIIEKEGDLELNSSLNTTLIFSYIEEEDISIPCGHPELIGANIKKLMRFAQKHLPTGITDASVIRIERRWVANSLPEWELLHALTFIYTRIHTSCLELARHLGGSIDESIPEGSTFDQISTDSRQIRYVTLNGLIHRSLRSKQILKSDEFTVPKEFLDSALAAKTNINPKNLEDNVKLAAEFAKATFDSFGSHVPMLFMYNSEWKVIDFISTKFTDTSSKYIFWRGVADRVAYMKPASIIWVSEAWVRKLDKSFKTAVRNMPLMGELLQIYGLDKDGNCEEHIWNIKRTSPDAKPTLEHTNSEEYGGGIKPNFLIPIKSAFAKMQ